MKHMIPAAAIAALMSLAPVTESGAAVPPCCACVPDISGQTSGNGHPPGIPAYFCSLGNTAEAENRCGDLQGILVCLAQGQAGGAVESSCRAALAAEGYLCPAAGAPAAGPFGLGLLALAFTGLGAAILRRRASRFPG
jgi:hypothetical protein